MNNQLLWVHEPATRPTDEEGKLNERIFGAAPDCHVAIHVDAMEDSDASAREGRPVFRNVVLVSIKNKGERDFISVPWTREHQMLYPRAAASWESRKELNTKVSVELLPGITPAEVAELRAIDLGDLEALAAGTVPQALAKWKELAVRFRTLSKPRVRLVDGELKEVA